MVEKSLIKLTGSAFLWRSLQLLGTKGIFTLRTLLLSYLLFPHDFGLFAVTIIAIDLLVTLTDFGLNSALIHQNTPDSDQYDSAWTLNLIRGVIISTLTFYFAPLISHIFAQPEAANLIRLASLKPLLDNVSSIKIAELTRQLKFKQLSYIKLSDAFVSTVVALALATTLKVWGLILGVLAGALISTILSYIFAPYKPKLRINLNAIKPIIHFSKWMYFSVVISVVGSLTLQIIITRELGAAQLGIYFLAIHLAFLPSEVIKEVFGSVMFPVFTKIRFDKEKLTIAYRAFLNILFVLIVPVCFLMIFTAPYLVSYILSAKWQGTVDLIQIFAAVNLIGLLGESSVPLFTAVGRTKNIFILDAVQSVLLLIFCFTFIKSWGINGAAAAWLPAVLASQLLSFIYITKILINPFKGMTAVMITVFISSLTGAFIGYFVTFSYSGVTGFLSGFFISGIVIVIAMLLTDHYYKLGIRRNFILAFPQIQSLGKFI